MKRRHKVLCFKCGEKFNPLHQCVEKQFRLVILRYDETLNKDEKVIILLKWIKY